MVKKSQNSEKIEKTTSIRGLEENWQPASTFGIERTFFTQKQGINLDTLYNVLKKSPEVNAAIMAIVEDIMADEWKYIGSDSAIKNARKFQLQSKFYKVLTNAIFDMLITGNAYILKLSVPESRIKDVATEISKRMAKKLKAELKKGPANQTSVFELIDQQFKVPQDLQLLKSSTMKINFDETGQIASYQQEVRGDTRLYRPQDIVHLSLINVGGEPYGFSGLEPLISDVATLIFAKEYAGKFFENDGIPHWLFLMPEEHPDSPNYKQLKKELQELKKQANKQRNLAITGKIEAKEIARFNKDMEYSKLIQHFTQIVLIALGVPSHRINWTILEGNSQAGSSVNRAFEGYYKRISFLQKLIEEPLNIDLFEVFNVEFKFNRSYKIDEMREAQIVQILTQVGAITIEEAREMMGLDPQLPKGTMPNATGDNNRVDFKEDQRREEGQDNNPKQPDAQNDNRTKVIKTVTETLEVSFENFLRLVENTMGEGNFNKAKIFYRETDTHFALYWSDSQWKYITRVAKNTIDVERFRAERLTFAVKILD